MISTVLSDKSLKIDWSYTDISNKFLLVSKTTTKVIKNNTPRKDAHDKYELENIYDIIQS